MCETEMKYIYECIKNNEVDHKLIKSYILDNNISYSKNNNGIFINLSILDDKYIIDIYNLIYNNTNNEIYNEREELLAKYNENNIILSDNSKKKKLTNKFKNIKEIKNIKIDGLNDIQLKIIELSKTI